MLNLQNINTFCCSSLRTSCLSALRNNCCSSHTGRTSCLSALRNNCCSSLNCCSHFKPSSWSGPENFRILRTLIFIHEYCSGLKTFVQNYCCSGLRTCCCSGLRTCCCSGLRTCCCSGLRTCCWSCCGPGLHARMWTFSNPAVRGARHTQQKYGTLNYESSEKKFESY